MVLGTTGCTQKLRTAAKNLIGFCSAYAHAVLCADMLQKKVLHTEKAQHKAHMASERTAVRKGVCVCVCTHCPLKARHSLTSCLMVEMK